MTPNPNTPNIETPQSPSPVLTEVKAPPLGSRGLDWAYEEYCARRDRGESVDPVQFCAEFPAFQSRLGQLLQAHLFLEENPELIDETRMPEKGERFLDYDLVCELGRGAFARVFLARETRLGDRLVALKVSWNGAEEAHFLGKLQHPNIVAVNSAPTPAGSELTALCMPYVGNTTLGDVIARLPTKPAVGSAILKALSAPPPESDSTTTPAKADPILQQGSYADGVRVLGAQLAEALAYLHSQGVYHRDLKPSNVLLTPAGVPMLIDFNLSKDAHTTAIVAGTMPYMAPEQLLHAATATEVGTDPRSEVYALGVMLFELATGTHPFGPFPDSVTTPALRDLLLQRQREPLPDVRAWNPHIEPSLGKLIRRCLAPDPKDRPQSATELANELRRQLRPRARLGRYLARNSLLVTVLASVLLAAVIATIAAVVTRPPRSVREYEAGVQLVEQGAYKEAVERFTRSLEDDPDNAETLLARGRALQEMGEGYLPPALVDLIEADRIAPSGRTKSAIAYARNLTRAHSGVRVEDYKEALKFGESAALLNNLAVSQMKSGGWELAEANLNRAIELDKMLRPAYHNRAMVHLHKAVDLQQKVPKLERASKFARCIDQGEKDVAKAIALGTESGDIYLEAARLLGIATKDDPRRKDDAFRFLKIAAEKGISREQIRIDYCLTSLRTDKRFQEVLQIAPEKTTASFAARIVNPLK